MGKVIVDEDTGEIIDNAELQKSLNVSDLTGQQQIKLDSVAELSERDTRAGKALCKEFIDSVVKLHLPDTIKNKPELLKVVELQQRFEEFSLKAMFSVVAQAVKLLDQLTVENDIYTPEGIIDNFKLQAIMNAQQHVMNVILQFNTHLRRLPGTLIDMMNDVERSEMVYINATEVHDETKELGNTTSRPIALLLKDVEKQLEDAQAEEVEDDDVVEPEPEPEPEQEDDDKPIELG
jgi:hypothetical protein